MNPDPQNKNNPQGNQESFYTPSVPIIDLPTQEKQPTCLQMALLYRQKGMCPIPIGLKKKPLIRWEEFQDRLPTEAEIKNWWAQWPNANVALVCGHGGLVVLDIDVKHQPPERKELADRIANDMINHAAVVTTPSGGKHIYFIETDGISKSGPLTGIGDLQGTGHFVLAPPSRGYKFENTMKALTIPHARDYVSDFLRQYGIAIDQQPHGLVKQGILANDIEETGRNNALISVAGSLRKRGADLETMLVALRAINQTKCKPPLLEDEVEGIAKSVMRYPIGRNDNFTSNPKDYTLEAKSLLTINAGELYQHALKGGTTVPFLPLLSQQGYIPEGWTTLIAGSPKVGKTELLTSLIKEWAQDGKNTVLYITEEPQQVWEKRLIQHADSSWEKVQLAFGIGANLPTILQVIEQAEERIVVIDTIRNILGLEEENNNSEVARTLNPIIGACRRLGKTLILSHHLRKGGGKYGEGISGGHAIFGAVDVALEISRDEQSTRRRLVRGWGRIVEVPELLYEMADNKVFHAIGDPREVEFEATKLRVLEIINDADDWLKTVEIHSKLSEPQPSEEQVRLSLKALASMGLILRDPDIAIQKIQGQKAKWGTRAIASKIQNTVLRDKADNEKGGGEQNE